jgi:hypothetical protein
MLFLLGMSRPFELRQRSILNKKNPENKLWALTHKQQGDINLAPPVSELGRAYAAAVQLGRSGCTIEISKFRIHKKPNEESRSNGSAG